MFVTLIAVVAVIGLAAAFMGTVDQSGLVTVEGGEGTTEGRTAIKAIIEPTPQQWTFSALARAALDACPNAACVVVDTVNRKVYFADDTGEANSLKNAATDALGAKMVRFTPDSNQTGRSITWSASNMNTPAHGTDYAAHVATAKPKVSVESLVSRVIGTMSGDTAIPPALVVIDQGSGKVYAVEDDNTAAVAALSLQNGNAGVLTLSEPPAGESAESLIFEGGSTSL